MKALAYCFGCGKRNVPAAEECIVGDYRVRRCIRCGTSVTEPTPTVEQLAAFYATYSDNYSAGMANARYNDEMPRRWRARLGRLRRLGATGQLLDLGGANGMFGAIAHAEGFKVSISDFVPNPIDLGFATVAPGDLSRVDGVPFPSDRFDVVTSWSCLEHVRDPDAALGETWRLLRNGGLLAIDTPLVGDICERLFAARSHWVAPPEHLTVFSAKGLRGAVERAGFRIELHEPFHERSALRWVLRRGRNAAVAGLGLALRVRSADRWRRARTERLTQAGDIQLLIARKVV